MLETVQGELIYIWYYFDIQLRQIFAYWILGMVIGSLVSVFAKDKIHHLRDNREYDISSESIRRWIRFIVSCLF